MNSQRTILDIRDAVEAYYLAAVKGLPGEIYNIGGQYKSTVGKILSKLINLSKKKIETSIDKKLLRPKDIKYQVPSSSKFIRQTKWKQQYTLSQSLNYLLNESREKFKFERRK